MLVLNRKAIKNVEKQMRLAKPKDWVNQSMKIPIRQYKEKYLKIIIALIKRLFSAINKENALRGFVYQIKFLRQFQRTSQIQINKL